MRASTRIATALVTVGLAASMAACSSSGSKDDTGGSKTADKSSSAPTPVGAFKTLTGKSTSVKLDPTFLAALTKLGVKPAPVSPGTVSADGVASFPITGGNATIYKKGTVTPYVQGEVDHKGGLSLTAGSTVVTLQNFIVDPGNNSNLKGEVLVNGAVFGNSDKTPVKLFDLDGSTLQTPTISSAGVATLTGTTVYVSQAAAGALNTAFKLTGTANALPTTFEAIKVGVATIEATGK